MESSAGASKNQSLKSLINYLLGDIVLAIFWGLQIVFTLKMSEETSPWLGPLWFYLGLCLLALLLPKPKAGIHELTSPETVKWFITFQFGRLWTFPPVKHFIFSFVTLRTIFLRCCGAKVSMNVGWSTISTISDPCMLVVESDVIIGIESMISGHLIINRKLYLAKITFKKGSLLGARCGVGPGVTVGENATIEGGTDLLPFAQIPNGAYIGKKSTIGKEMKLEENKRYPGFLK